VIRQTPGAFVLLTVIAFVAAYLLAKSEYKGQIESRDATIVQKDSSIQNLQTELQFQDDRLAVFEGKSAQPLGVSQARIKFIQFSRLDVNGRYGVNIVAQNVGTAPAINTVHSDFSEFTPRMLTAAELDTRFNQLYANMGKYIKTMPLPDSQKQPNDILFWTSTNSNTTPDQVKNDVINGTGYLYSYVIYQYRDPDVPPGKWRVTEVCQYATGKQAEHDCDNHNQIFLSK